MAEISAQTAQRARSIPSSQETRIFAAVAAVALVFRAPFLTHGYGTDPDAWRVSEAARQMASTHVYTPSRLPGNPVQEIVSALIRGGGPLALNGATAVMSAVAAGFFTLSLGRLGRREAVVAGLALAFTPVVYVNSVSAMDYLWALGFIMASLYALLCRRVVLSGVLLGLAVGCRPTSCLFVLPFCLFLRLELEEGESKAAWRLSALKLCAVGGATGLACYVPVFQRFGRKALIFEPNHPGLVAALKAATLDTWGLIGLLALGAAVVAVAIDHLRTRPAPSLRPLAPWLLAIGIYLLLFAALPNEAGYLIPVVPFVILGLGALLPYRRFVALTCALVASSFFLGVGRQATPGGPVASRLAMPINLHGQGLILDPLQGPVLAADSARRESVAYVARVIARGASLPGNNVILAGYWYTQLSATLHDEAPRREQYVERLTQEELERYEATGCTIHYLARQDAYNVYTGGVDLATTSAHELVLDGDAKAAAAR
jgi:hypothetical protein